MIDRNKPSTRLHEVIDNSFELTMIVFCGPKSKCFAWYDAQEPQKRQDLEVRVAGR
jgi:hypothetical protein